MTPKNEVVHRIEKIDEIWTILDEIKRSERAAPEEASDRRPWPPYLRKDQDEDRS